MDLDKCINILTQLVGFESISAHPNEPIVSYIQDYLAQHGIESTLSYDKSGLKANLFATIGPHCDGGLVFNGHTDVVPVAGQNWSTPPFTLTAIDDKLFGRGSVDMKGFLACMLASVSVFKDANLKKPIHLAFSFDEEIGGFGMPFLLDSIDSLGIRPEIVIVGEPTDMKLITAHKGGYEMRTEVIGYEVHSCDPTLGVNAIAVASQLINKIYDIAQRLSEQPHADSEFVPPYCTFNVGIIEGGMATNATAGQCHFNWEFRPMPGEDGQLIISELQHYAETELLPAMKEIHEYSAIDIITDAPVPALNDKHAAKAAEFVSSITGLNSRDVVSFGTDAGYFSDKGMSTVVFGPGSISRAHKPNEFIKRGELQQGMEFMQQVAQRLSQ
ncbi:MAG: acetylornithine deacetylase [Granulosicoccus sp.]